MSPLRVPVKPELLLWARERAGLSQEDVTQKKPNLKLLEQWEKGEGRPTLNQLEQFARAVHVPVDYLFLSRPPMEDLPIPDFRTLPGESMERPNPNLLDTLYACQERQEWYRDYAIQQEYEEVAFVGSATVDSHPFKVAQEMYKEIGFAPHEEPPGVARAFSKFVRAADTAGVLVMVNGIVGNNTRRKLDPEEFRGFALSDTLAPLVFVNGADAKVAQMFTLAHEIAHLWLGKSALTNFGTKQVNWRNVRQEEVWCNRVAAEYLVPEDALQYHMQEGSALDILDRLHRIFKISTKAILIRLLDAGLMPRAVFEDTLREIDRKQEEVLESSLPESTGGDFHRLVRFRVGRRFSNALIASTLQGRTLYRDACLMLGIRSAETFDRFAKKFT